MKLYIRNIVSHSQFCFPTLVSYIQMLEVMQKNWIVIRKSSKSLQNVTYLANFET